MLADRLSLPLNITRERKRVQNTLVSLCFQYHSKAVKSFQINNLFFNLKPEQEAKQEQRGPAPNPKKRVTASSVVQKSASSSLPNKNRAIYIVLHVSTIQIGDLVAKASAPVKVHIPHTKIIVIKSHYIFKLHL